MIVGADDVAASKPAPDSYLAAAAALGVDPSACVAVEDSLWGLRAARGGDARHCGDDNVAGECTSRG